MPTLTPAAHEDLMDATARVLAADLQKQNGQISDWFLIDLKTVAQMTGLTRKQILNRIPITTPANRHSGVLFGNLRTFLENRTTTPKTYAP
jgi:hypothetical protein